MKIAFFNYNKKTGEVDCDTINVELGIVEAILEHIADTWDLSDDDAKAQFEQFKNNGDTYTCDTPTEVVTYYVLD